MPNISYESIEPLLVRAEESGDAIMCTFKCPVSGATFDASGTLQKGRGLAEVMRSERTLVGSLRQALGGLLRGALGGGPQGSPDPDPNRVPAERASGGFSEDERKAGVLLAFRSISNRWVWTDTDGWIAAQGAGELMSEFSSQLRLAPVVERVDRDVLSRMLVELARADGRVTRQEWAFLAEFIPPDICSVDTFMEKPALTPDELAGTTLGAARDTMLMLAWALALTDEDLDAEEAEQVLAFAKGLRIPSERALELKRFSQLYLLDQALEHAYPKGRVKKRRRKKALALGERIGLAADEVVAEEALFKRRNDIA